MGPISVKIYPDGEMQEWFNWPLSKSGVPQGTKGSNPFLSAKFDAPPVGVLNLAEMDLNPWATDLSVAAKGSA